MDMSQEYLKVEVLEKDYLMSMGEMKTVYKLKGHFKGIDTMIWLTGDGEVLREDSPMGFSLVKETKETATKLTKPSIDVVKQVSVPFNLSLSPYTIKYLKVRVSGVDFKKLEVDGGRQRLNGDILEITQESRESMVAHGLTSTSFLEEGKRGFLDEYLKETTFVQSKDPAIVALSREIIGEQRDLLEMTRMINEWVYKNIKKVPMITMPVATDVLKIRRGDCNEHTVLFTALSRSAGIPTRIAVGLTYQNRGFYYHAWPEVYFNEWVAVDPTLGQFPADASHIRLLTGDIDRQVQLISIIGKIKLEGIEYR
jgi:transglutaminase-like putative cysteine protease